MSEDPTKSEWAVRVVQLGKVERHPDADTLSVADAEGYPVVVKTGEFKEGDCAVYVPVDSVVPTVLAQFAFLAKDDRHLPVRVKARRLRGVLSMGLLVPTGLLGLRRVDPERSNGFAWAQEHGGRLVTALTDADVRREVVEPLGVTRYEPPDDDVVHGQPRRRRVPKGNPGGPVYGVAPLRRYGSAIPRGTTVMVTEKIHGTSARFCLHDGRLWWGGHNNWHGCDRRTWIGRLLDRTWRRATAALGFRRRLDVYREVAEKFSMRERLACVPEMIFYGEVYGHKVQKLKYDAPKSRNFRAFAVYDRALERFVADEALVTRYLMTADLLRDHSVPVLEIGRWTAQMEEEWRAAADRGDRSRLADHHMEGFVVRPLVELRDPRLGRVELKYKGAKFMLGDNE